VLHFLGNQFVFKHCNFPTTAESLNATNYLNDDGVLRVYPQRKRPWYPMDRRVGEPQRHSGCGGEEKYSQPPPGIEP
jgi:hypothetical protein